ncbi:hypothetical protein CAPI_06870 [Corynebacterium capitovis DSM 44611]|uniref:hypothetical protein n=1 Tax=Corynebacterium capitovis TaxID=131081 RepID=UPI0003AB1D80|nr:hypothetical protein [Corynebacterium capitovis]WKD57914.1 hypothetical protein CAPI_06870 [Corynebacterium capitovis DSM 44611]
MPSISNHIDPSYRPANLNEAGRAQVVLPIRSAGTHTLRITTDAGTDISLPLTVGEGASTSPALSSPLSSLLLR